LYLLPGLQLPPIAERPTRTDAELALNLLKDLLLEFSFKRKELDRSIALSALLTAQLRGSLPTAPVHLVNADTPRNWQKLSDRRHLHDRERPVMPRDHGLQEHRGDGEAARIDPPGRRADGLAR